jgi:hypothetical protein
LKGRFFALPAALLLLTLPAYGQATGPAGIRALDFLIGSWTCAHTVGDFSGTYSTIFTRVLGDRWIRQIYAFPADERRAAVQGDFLIGYDPRNQRWLRTGAMSDGLYFSMVGTQRGNAWYYGYVLPGTAGSAVYTKKSDSEYTVDGPEYPENGKMVTEHHRCTKTEARS